MNVFQMLIVKCQKVGSDRFASHVGSYTKVVVHSRSFKGNIWVRPEIKS